MQTAMKLAHLELEHSLGKGEAVSSILTGSTKKPVIVGVSRLSRAAVSAVHAGTEPEPRKSHIGESAENKPAEAD